MMVLSKSAYVGTRKMCELCLHRANPEETMVEARTGSDVQIDRQMLINVLKTNRTIKKQVPDEVYLSIAEAHISSMR